MAVPRPRACEAIWQPSQLTIEKRGLHGQPRPCPIPGPKRPSFPCLAPLQTCQMQKHGPSLRNGLPPWVILGWAKVCRTVGDGIEADEPRIGYRFMRSYKLQ